MMSAFFCDILITNIAQIVENIDNLSLALSFGFKIDITKLTSGNYPTWLPQDQSHFSKKDIENWTSKHIELETEKSLTGSDDEKLIGIIRIF